MSFSEIFTGEDQNSVGVVAEAGATLVNRMIRANWKSDGIHHS